MRKTSLFGRLLVFFLGIMLPLSARLQTSPPEATQRPLIEVLVELNKVRGVYFLFSRQPLGQKLVTPPAPSPALSTEKLLTQLLRNTGLYYKKVDDRTFVILERRPADPAAINDTTAATQINDPSAVAPVIAPPNRVSGRVFTGEGKNLQGVSVTLLHTRKGTTTDYSGAFQLEAQKEDTLVFSFVGYQLKKLPVSRLNDYGVRLDPSDEPLTEVLVTALGIQKQRKSLGFSAEELDGSVFTQSRETNLGNALVGQVAGVSVAQNATGPYGSSRVIIRGNASLSGNNQPLYIVDGIPYDNTTVDNAGQFGGLDLGDGLSNINPDNIESVLILKSVAASALYGYRGGNGAILIRTKSGSKTRGFGVQVNNNLTLNSVVDERDYQYVYGQGLSGKKPFNKNMALAAPYYSWGAKLDGSDAINYLGDHYSYSPVRDNYRRFFRTGVTNQSAVALTGANNRGHFRLGLSDLHLGTIVPNSSMKQQGFNLNSTYYVTNRLQMELTADYVFEQVDNRASLSDDPGNVFAPPLYLANSMDIRWMKNRTIKPDGTEWLPGTDPYFENPYYIARNYNNVTDRNRITGGLTLKYNLFDWLYLQGQVSRDGYQLDVTNIVPSGVVYTRFDGVHGGNLTQYEVNYHELNGIFMVGVHRRLGKDISLDANLGANRQDNSRATQGIGAVPGSFNRAAGPFLAADNYNASNIINKPYSSFLQRYRVNSIYGNADIGYKDWLFLNLTARDDWFSTLNINTDRYLYPSVSASFIFSGVWRLPSWVTLGKLRASYAGSSNGTEPYQNVLNYGIRNYSINGQPLGYIASGDLPLIPNASLRPISIAEKEVGLVGQFLKDRLGFDITYYNKETTSDIVKVTISPTSGYYQYIANIGKIRNRGLELLLTGTPVMTKNFSWKSTLNLAVNNNEVMSIGGLPSIAISNAYPRWGSEVSISNVVGLPYGQIMGYAYRRDPKGRIIYSDGISNPAPAGEPEPSNGVVPLGSTVYKQTGGLTNELHYRDWSFATLIDFKFGAKIYSGTNLLLYYYGLHKNTLQGREGGYIGKGVLDNGHPNTLAVPAQQYFQDISAGGSDHIAEEFVYDASFIKWRSVSLTYSVPSSMLKKKFITGLSLSLVGRNLATLMKRVPNIDPESSINNTNGQGLELSGYPLVRSWGFNVNFKF
jgi:TonB-linked SusC/RagA family outer membrane protein